jgi:tetratricopeptide (TPR) repeat protein
MRSRKKTLPFPGSKVERGRLEVFSLPMLALAVFFFTGDARLQVLAAQDQPKNESGNQVEIRVVSDDEYKAFEAAREETDPQKRAQKLFDFIQKHPKSPLVQQISLADYKNIKVIEDEYAAYFAAKQAPDLEKRADMLIEFVQKHPHSPLEQNIDYDYTEMMKEASQEKKYELLEALADKWLKIYPKDTDAYEFSAEATLNLKEYEKCGESLEELYAMKPSPALARQIYSCYQKADNLPKQTGWAEKLFQMPEFDSDYMLRYGFVVQFAKEDNLAKAAEYAQLTLKSLSLTQSQDAATREKMRQVRRACYHTIGSNLLEKGSFSEAITAFENALKAERYGEGYYKIAVCLDNQREVEKALLYYAVADLMGGEYASKAKSRLEELYRALHNNTLVGIDKVYQRGKELLEEPENKIG